MSKRWKMKQRGELGRNEAPPSPPLPRDTAYEKEWLAQFATPVDENTLTEQQRKEVAYFRSQFPAMKVARRTDGRLSVYCIDPITGPMAGDINE